MHSYSLTYVESWEYSLETLRGSAFLKGCEPTSISCILNSNISLRYLWIPELSAATSSWDVHEYQYWVQQPLLEICSWISVLSAATSPWDMFMNTSTECSNLSLRYVHEYQYWVQQPLLEICSWIPVLSAATSAWDVHEYQYWVQPPLLEMFMNTSTECGGEKVLPLNLMRFNCNGKSKGTASRVKLA